MSELPDDFTQSTPIARDELLHRALLRKRLINEDTAEVKPEAFLRRRNEDGSLKESGLSVDRASMRTAQEFVLQYRPWRGVVGLYAGQVRDTRLEVVPEIEPPNAPSHAEIIGWPDGEDEADAEEERLAGLLARQAIIVWLEK